TALFILFVPAILIAAILGGIGPGLLALALSIAGSFLIASSDPTFWVQITVFALVGLVIAWMGAMLHHARRVLDRIEETLMACEAHMRSIVVSDPDASVVVDARGPSTSSIGGAVRQFGAAKDVDNGGMERMQMPEPDRGQPGECIRRYLTAGERRMLGVDLV